MRSLMKSLAGQVSLLTGLTVRSLLAQVSHRELSNTLTSRSTPRRQPQPCSLSDGGGVKGSRGPGWEKGTGRLCDPWANARAVNGWSSKMWWAVQSRVRLGKGRGNSFPSDKESLALCLMRGVSG